MSTISGVHRQILPPYDWVFRVDVPGIEIGNRPISPVSAMEQMSDLERLDLLIEILLAYRGRIDAKHRP